MKNSLTVTTVDGHVCTEFVTTDGVTTMEIHRTGLSESKVLEALLKKKFYQHFKGEWAVTFPDDQWAVNKATFEDAVSSAEIHIFNRDNSYPDYSGFA